MNEECPETSSGLTLSQAFADLRRALQEDGSAPSPSLEDGPPLARGAIVDRYVVDAPLGNGAMGIVYSAHDPELRRKVALKLLLVPASGEAVRLQREAQALARVVHPNVVTVYDAGTLPDGRVWIAMELVNGGTLRKWARAGRPWPEVLRAVKDAAAGLAAVHDAGLVHRDIKPDNIMIGDDARVRVMDFGLAQRRSPALTDEELAMTAPSQRGPSTANEGRLTATGAIPGTPPYLAPEQWQGRDAGRASDQFAWCVTAWELLYGARPYAGRTLAALEASVTSGPPALPRNKRVPRWIGRVIARGLAVDPDRRHRDMHELIAALERDPTRRRGMTLGAVAAVTAVVAGLAVRHAYRETIVAACAADGDSITGVWNDESSRYLAASLRASGASFADATVDDVTARLDDYAAAWRSARSGTCWRESLAGTWEPALAAEARACLDERREHLDTLLTVLSSSETGVTGTGTGLVEVATTAIAGLPRIAACQDVRRLLARPRPLDLGATAHVRAIRTTLVEASALEAAGRYKDALPLAEQAQREANALDWAPVRAEATLRRGSILEKLALYAQAEENLELAHDLAGEAAYDEVAAEAAASLAFVVGYHAAPRYREGIRWGKTALMLLNRTRDSHDAFVRAQALDNLGSVYEEQRELARAKEHYESALALFIAAAGREHPKVAVYLRHVAGLHYEVGEYARAQAILLEALDVIERTQGKSHPSYASTLINFAAIVSETGDVNLARELYMDALAKLAPGHPNYTVVLENLGHGHMRLGEYAQAIDYHRRSLELREKELGPTSPKLARTLTNLASGYIATGQYDRALPLQRRALTILEGELGPDNPELAASLTGLGHIFSKQGHHDLALQNYERALALLEKSFPADHPAIAVILGDLGVAYQTGGQFSRSVEYLERALAIKEATLPPGHPAIAGILHALGFTYIQWRREAKARPYFERALHILETSASNPNNLAHARFGLALTLWPQREERARARALAERARDQYIGAGPNFAGELADTVEWLKTHTLRPARRAR